MMCLTDLDLQLIHNLGYVLETIAHVQLKDWD